MHFSSDEEEDDLELLRLAALKSRRSKEDVIATNVPHVTPPQSEYKRNAAYSYSSVMGAASPTYQPPEMPGYRSALSSMHVPILPGSGPHRVYYPPVHPPQLPLLPTRQVAVPSHIDSAYNAPRQALEQLDINEPYVPQHLPSVANLMGEGGAAIMAPHHSAAAPNGWLPESAMPSSAYVPPYVPHKPHDPIRVSNVQLSPRSLAFVAQNNDILMRRKGEGKSPKYAAYGDSGFAPYSPSRSPSPDRSPNVYVSPRYSPTTPQYRPWSQSPPQKIKSRSPPVRANERAARYPNRRSNSRSPVPLNAARRSPGFRRRSTSRSPTSAQGMRKFSPIPPHRYGGVSPPPALSTTGRRGKSRSPPPARRHLSRSPPQLNRGNRPLSRTPPLMQSSQGSSNGRRRSPLHQTRYQNKLRRSLSPSVHSGRRSPAHDSNDQSSRFVGRGRSPKSNFQSSGTTGAAHERRRSHSPRSPVRKINKNNSNRERGAALTARRRSPYNNSRNRRNDQPVNIAYRNRGMGRKRSVSPNTNDVRKKRSRTKSPNFERNRRDTRPKRTETRNRYDDNKTDRQEFHKTSSNGKTLNAKDNTNELKVEKELQKANSPSVPDRNDEEIREEEERLTPPPISVKEHNDDDENDQDTGKTQELLKQQDDETLQAIEEEDKESSSDESVNDGIDLFASEESEAENEGRFKSSSSRNERDKQAPTLSFAKLGAPFVPVEVKDLKDVEANSKHVSSSLQNTRDRDRKTGRYNRRSQRTGEDRFRKSDNNRNSSRRDRSRGPRDRRERDGNRPKSEEKKHFEDKPKFKSTFQAVESEASRPSSRNGSEKETSERKASSYVQKTISKSKESNKEYPTDKENTTADQSQSGMETVASASTTISSSASMSAAIASTVTSKKSIHLRLGAKTNTFKPAKKSASWNATTEKV